MSAFLIARARGFSSLPVMPLVLRFSFPVLAIVLVLTGCTTTGQFSAQLAQRDAAIAAEPRGDYFIGRRFFIDRTQFWGYVRRPGQSWDKSKLTIFNEKFTRSPDRLPEARTDGGRARGYDHNWEYKLWGYYSGRRIYDPNSNLFLPEFILQRYEVISTSPGWLFKPGERFRGDRLMRAEPDAMP